MDRPLLLLKKYLDERITSYEKLIGQPIGATTLELRMLVNSNPGIIKLFVGTSEPNESRVSTVDVWYNRQFFSERTQTEWRRFDTYRDEFTTTIVNINHENFPVDVPVSIEIEGLEFVDVLTQKEARYQVFMVLESGARHPLDEATLSLVDHSVQVVLTQDAENGDALLSFEDVDVTTNFILEAVFHLSDNHVIRGELPIQAYMEGSTVDEIYTITIQGPDTVKVGQSGNYVANLHTKVVSSGEEFDTDISANVVWQLVEESAGAINELGSFTPGDDGSLSRVVTLRVTYEVSRPNGSVFEVYGSRQVQIIKMAVAGVDVTGPDTVKENNTAAYSVVVRFMNGEEGTEFVPVWELEQPIGEISEEGVFAAPMVAADTPQKIKATVVYAGQPHVGEKDITILQVVDPVLVIAGPDSIYEDETAQFTATLSFEGETWDVTPQWTLTAGQTPIGRIDATGLFSEAATFDNTQVGINAFIEYQGYSVTANKTIMVVSRALKPMSLALTGPAQVVEGSNTNFFAEAFLSDGTSEDVSSSVVWSVNDNNHSIGAAGVFHAGQVNFDVVVTVRGEYTRNGVTQVSTRQVTVKDDPEVWTPETIVVNGPNQVNEGTTANYTANITMRSSKGTTRVDTAVPVEWLVDSRGSISTGGVFTAASVTANSAATITAIYNDGQNLPLTATKNITVINVPLLTNLQVTLGVNSIFGGFSTSIVAMLTRSNGSTVDVTTHANITYQSSDITKLSVDKATATVNAVPADTTKNFTIVATYVEAGETITGNATIEVTANTADTLLITPASSTVFENGTVQYGAKLTLTDSSQVNVTPVWALANPLAGTIDAAGLFKAAASLASDSVATSVTAKYAGQETGNLEVDSNTASLTVRKIAPQTLEVFNDSANYAVNEGAAIFLSGRVTLTNGTITYPENIAYSLSAQDEQYASLEYDAQTNVLIITGKDVTQDRMISVKGTYTHPDAPSGKLEATRLVSVKYVRQLTGYSLTIAAGPYFQTRNYALTLRERFDDNSLGATITQGITWTATPGLVSVANSAATIQGASGTFSINASVGGVSSNTINGAINVNSPVSLMIFSTEGDQLERDGETVLTASLIMADDQIITPSPTWPVTWTINDGTAGTLLTDIDYSALFTAASLTSNRTVRVTATAGGVSSHIDIQIAGFAIPAGAVVSGPSTVESGKTANYTLTVTMSDNTTRVINNVGQLTADWSISFVNGAITKAGQISSKGELVAPEHAAQANVIGAINASWTDPASGRSVTAVPYDVNVTPVVPVTPVSAVLSGVSTIASGATQNYTLTVNMSDSTQRVIDHTHQTYNAVFTVTPAVGSLTAFGRYTAPVNPVGQDVTIKGEYTLNGQTVSSELPVRVQPQIATALLANPNTITVFEGESQQVTVTTNTGVTVQPTWSSTNSTFGTMSASGLFQAASNLNSNQSANWVGRYTGPETNGNELTVSVATTVTDIVPLTVTVAPTAGPAVVNEQSSIQLKTSVAFNNGTNIAEAQSVVYEITSGQSFATISSANGIATLNSLSVIQNQTVVVTATYTAPDGKTKTGTLSIQVVDSIKQVVDIVVDSTQPAPYYEGTTVALRARQKFDDGSFSAPLTAGVSWTVSNTAYATVAGTTATLAAVTGDKTVTFSATYDGKSTVTPLSITVVDIVPASVAITSANGSTIKRGLSTTFTAKITLNNGTQVDPSASYPVNWSNTNAAAGAFQQVGQTYTWTAAASNTDVAFSVSATTGNNKVGTLAMTLDGYPIPSSAVINGLTEVAAGITSDYTMVVTMSDASTRQISATQTTYSASWTTDLSFTGSGGSFNGATGRLTPGSTWADRNGKIMATYTDTVSGLSVNAEKTMTIKAAVPVPVPANATLTGATSLAAGAVADYTLTVPMTDGSTRKISPTDVAYTATWTANPVVGTLVNGRFTAHSPATAQNVVIRAIYTVGATTVDKTITVNVAAVPTTTPAPVDPLNWEDAVYVGSLPNTYGASLTNTVAPKGLALLKNTISPNTGQTFIRKIANGTKLLPDTTQTLHQWQDTGALIHLGAGGSVSERFVILYPKKYGVAGSIDMFDGGQWYPGSELVAYRTGSNAIVASSGGGANTLIAQPVTVQLKVNGVAMDFYMYIHGTVSPPSGSTVDIRARISS